MYQLHIRETPGRPRVAIAAGAALFALAVGLCAALVHERKGLELGDRVAPAGWSVTFRPPGGWVEEDPFSYIAGYEVHRFSDPAKSSAHRQLWVGRVRNAHDQAPSKLCRAAMLAFFSNVPSIGERGAVHLVRTVPLQWAALGPFGGVKAVASETGDYFAFGIDPAPQGSAEAYAIEYHRVGALDAYDLAICEGVALSFQRNQAVH